MTKKLKPSPISDPRKKPRRGCDSERPPFRPIFRPPLFPIFRPDCPPERPDFPSRPPSDKTVKIFTVDQDNNPLPSCQVYVNDFLWCYTTHEGNETLHDMPSACFIQVKHENYHTASSAYRFTEPYTEITVRLQKIKTLFNPDRAYILSNPLRTNIAITPVGGEHSPWFTGALPLMSGDARKELFQMFHDRGLNSIMFNFVMNYGGYGSYDLTQEVDRGKALIDECHENEIIPHLCLQLRDSNGEGQYTVDNIAKVLQNYKGYVKAGFFAWELTVTDGPSQYTYDQIQNTIREVKNFDPEFVLGMEFAQPADRIELIHYDGRGIQNAIDYWTMTEAKHIDIFLEELPRDYVEDKAYNDLIATSGGLRCRIGGLFPIPDTYPDGYPIPEEVKKDWSTDWGIHKKYVHFEYASFSQIADEEKTNIRQQLTSTLSTDSYGEG